MAGSRAVKSVTVAVYRSSADVISDVLFCTGLNGQSATPVTRSPSTSDNRFGCKARIKVLLELIILCYICFPYLGVRGEGCVHAVGAEIGRQVTIHPPKRTADSRCLAQLVYSHGH